MGQVNGVSVQKRPVDYHGRGESVVGHERLNRPEKAHFSLCVIRPRLGMKKLERLLGKSVPD